jgi:hypothetical protein
LWAWLMFLPNVVPLLQISHRFAMVVLLTVRPKDDQPTRSFAPVTRLGSPGPGFASSVRRDIIGLSDDIAIRVSGS